MLRRRIGLVLAVLFIAALSAHRPLARIDLIARPADGPNGQQFRAAVTLGLAGASLVYDGIAPRLR